ncbi:MAG: hypothetical protein NC110_06645 [Ruminococcus sp.]|nr:hypothetical protein [Ruminococcus sp.]
MGKIFDFKKLISDFHVDFHIIKLTEGRYDHGKYIDGEPILEKRCGAIVPMSSRRMYSMGGTYNQSDRDLYTIKPLADDLSRVRVVYKNQVYSIEQSTDYSDYCDAYLYNLKWVGVFDDKNYRNLLSWWT